MTYRHPKTSSHGERFPAPLPTSKVGVPVTGGCKHPKKEIVSRWVNERGEGGRHLTSASKIHKEYTCLECGKTFDKKPDIITTVSDDCMFEIGKPHTCEWCRWWEKDTQFCTNYEVTGISRVSCNAILFFEHDFGCIFWEKKERE